MKFRGALSLLLLILLMCTANPAFATHNRAGEITYKRIEPFTKVVAGKTVQVYTYSITVTMYTDDGDNIANRCVDTLDFGDGSRGIAPRINGDPCTLCPRFGTVEVGCGVLILNEANHRVKVNTYSFVHTYAGPGRYLLRTFDPNRNADVKNIPNSINQPFYIESWLVIQPFTGANSSPVFNFAPIDKACVGACFQHNPGAYDPDKKDSLSYELTTSRGLDGETVTGYTYPNAGTSNTYSIDSRTGLLSWCTPQIQGEYNLAFIVKEWRRNTGTTYDLIGYVMRDMQVIVQTCPNNKPPILVVPKDTCVEAGTLVSKPVLVNDPDNGSRVTVTGAGGPFSAPSPSAVLLPTVGITYTNTPGYTANFQWMTTCDHIRNQVYQATFKAEDSGIPTRLVSFASFDIRVVPPSVKNVTTSPEGSNMRIHWSGSTCGSTLNPLVRYEVYRKNDCVPYIPSPCQTGVPGGNGFVKIGEAGASATDFLDNNNGDGLVVGQNYSYIVVAVYKDGTLSFSGTQVCSKLRRNVPVITNVDVNSTSQSGEVILKWILPVTGQENLDTLQLQGPYTINVKWKKDNAMAVIATFSSPYFLNLPVQYTHTAVNTVEGPNEYLLEFLSGTVTVGESQRAGSVFLEVTPSDRRMDLSWSAKTPWLNTSYTVHRKVPGAAAFDIVGTTTATTYADDDRIVNRNEYCYFVTSSGMYSDTTIVRPLYNRSQQVCSTARDLTPPCVPTLSLDADCPVARVVISWDDIKVSCRDHKNKSDDVVSYELYFKPTVNGEYMYLSAFSHTASGFYESDRGEIISGCYAILAVDSNSNRSALSAPFCVDNCPIFELPNIFTPDDDGTNDYFQAVRVRQIKEIDLVVYDRWGNLVYRTSDPFFKWEGISAQTKLPVSDGTLFYICEVFEPRLTGIVKRTLKGFVHVAR